MRKIVAVLAIVTAGVLGISGTAHAGMSSSTVNAKAGRQAVFGKGTTFPMARLGLDDDPLGDFVVPRAGLAANQAEFDPVGPAVPAVSPVQAR